jgi:PST family polysaccharide transporter
VGHFVAPTLVPLLFGAGWSASLPILDVFLIAVPIHVLTVMWGYPLAAALDRQDVANRSVVFGASIYVLLAVVLVLAGRATPRAFAWLVLVCESYVLVHRVVALWPEAHRRLTRGLLEAART